LASGIINASGSSVKVQLPKTYFGCHARQANHSDNFNISKILAVPEAIGTDALYNAA